MTLTRSQIDELPKVELHVHLEGTLDARRIGELAAAAGQTLPRPPEQLFQLPSLSAFLDFLDWTCSLVSTPELASQLAYDYAAAASATGIVYAEVIVNPTHWPAWELGALVDAITDGFERAEREGLAECHLLLSILRSQTATEADALVEWIERHRPARVLGLSVDGNEATAGHRGERFVDAYRRAGEIGLGRTAHAGESSGADGVLAALDLLVVDRIDHGVRASDNPEVVQRLAENGVALNVCLSSNLIHLYPDLAAHPIAGLVAAGVPVTLATDDPGYLGIDLSGEFAKAAEHLGWSLDDLAAVTRRAIDAAFCPPPTRARLHLRLDDHLKSKEHSS